jgi:type I restriction enzyme S subunit
LTQAYDSWTQQIFIQATIQNIGADKYSNLWFAIPDTHKEQQEIVAYLDKKCAEIDALISANESTIEKLKEYRQSVIYEAVTGKVEI